MSIEVHLVSVGEHNSVVKMRSLRILRRRRVPTSAILVCRDWAGPEKLCQVRIA